MTPGLFVRTGTWLRRYLDLGDYSLRKLFRVMAQDVAVAAVVKARAVTGRDGVTSATPRGRHWARLVRGHEMRRLRQQQTGSHFRAPQDLAQSATPFKRILVIGTCLAHEWQQVFEKSDFGCPADFVLLNHAGELPNEPPGDYDFQVVQFPLRTIMPDCSLARLPFDDLAAHEALFADAKTRLSQFLVAALRWNESHGLLSFVTNLLVPQQNPMGRLMPRYDLRNPCYFVEQLNVHLGAELKLYSNAYLLDIDQIAASLGKKFVQDDAVWHSSNGSILNNYDDMFDRDRLEPVGRMSEHYRTSADAFFAAVCAEVAAMYRTVRQIDQVKLVAIDLDDILWRGVPAEADEVTPQATEGWPLGLAEALLFLRKRGVLLAIVSRNEESRVLAIWDAIMGGRMSLDDFAFRRINWRPKPDNLDEILAEANLLPRSVVFVDDNPVERAGVAAAFPDMRILGSQPYYLRRILLWSPETQVAQVSAESARRSEMMQAQVVREGERKRLSRPEFLATLGITVKMLELRSTRDSGFARAFELINKTNQFNTTGLRWTEADCEEVFRRNAVFYAFQVQDRFTAYGLVGVAIAENGVIGQFVMSCRVLGLDVEIGAVREIVRRMRAGGASAVSARLIHTDANHPCRDLYERCGFRREGEIWIAPGEEAATEAAHVAWA